MERVANEAGQRGVVSALRKAADRLAGGLAAELRRAVRPGWDAGASAPKRVAWYFVNLAVVYNPWLPISLPRVVALRLFGARIGRNVTIRPFVKVKFPWRLECGDAASIGEAVWIDNLDWVRIGSGSVVSQRSYLCTGNHDWRSAELPLRTAPITIGSGCWVGADSVVLPGAVLEDDVVLTAGSSATGTLPRGTICSGRPARPVKPRR